MSSKNNVPVVHLGVYERHTGTSKERLVCLATRDVGNAVYGRFMSQNQADFRCAEGDPQLEGMKLVGVIDVRPIEETAPPVNEQAQPVGAPQGDPLGDI